MAANGVIAELEARCDERGAEPRKAALLAILDLSAGLLAFNGVRSAGELFAWLRSELPARAEELARMNGAVADDDLRSFPHAPARRLALRREANEEGA
jgi:hypothetical protein